MGIILRRAFTGSGAHLATVAHFTASGSGAFVPISYPAMAHSHSESCSRNGRSVVQLSDSNAESIAQYRPGTSGSYSLQSLFQARRLFWPGTNRTIDKFRP